MTVTAYRTFDTELVHRVMTSPEIWVTVAEDGHDPMTYVPDVVKACWVAVYADDCLVALYSIERLNSVTAEIHAQVLPRYRKEYSMATGSKVLEWLWQNAAWCSKAIAWVPTLYPNVRDFTLAHGFKVEGTCRKSYLKNGELHDRWLLGLSRGKG